MIFSFSKTTILPTDNAKFAQKVLGEILDQMPCVLFIVVGRSQHVEKTVKMANSFAGTPLEARWVVWIRKPDQVIDILKALEGPVSIPDFRKDLAFSVSLDNEIRFSVGLDEAPAKKSQILRGYLKAEKATETVNV